MIYVATVKEAERLYEQLKERLQHRAVSRQDVRRPIARQVQEAFMDGELKAIIATNAFGLGHRQAGHSLRRALSLSGIDRVVLSGGGTRRPRWRAGDVHDALSRRRPAHPIVLPRRQVSRGRRGGEGGARAREVSARDAGRARATSPSITEVPQRKAKIVFALLKRHGLVREHRGGSGSGSAATSRQCDLSHDLTDYEERRANDQKKLRTIIEFCQTTECRTKFILEHFGEEVSADVELRKL